MQIQLYLTKIENKINYIKDKTKQNKLKLNNKKMRTI